MDDFTPFALEPGLRFRLQDNGSEIEVTAWAGGKLDLLPGATHYGMVTGGSARVNWGEFDPFPLRAGMFFVLPGPAAVQGEHGSGLVITLPDYSGLPAFGGPLEGEGRLRYIDGCSDTLLVAPPRLGDPCLNHLHIPPGVNQTAHTHPSARIGVIARGSGECRTPRGAYPLREGMGWYIPTGCLHSFHTEEESLDVVAWHPDSDFGPTNQNHPMLNRTQIRTK